MTKALMEKEEYRWSYMSHEAMERRLYTMTNIKKLTCFIFCADKYHNPELKHLALEKLEFLTD